MKLIPISKEGNRQIVGGWLVLFALVLAAYVGPQPIEAGAKTPTHGDESAPLFAKASGAYHVEVRSARQDAASQTYEAEIGQTQAATAQDRNRIAAQAVFDEAEQLRAKGDLESLQ